MDEVKSKETRSCSCHAIYKNGEIEVSETLQKQHGINVTKVQEKQARAKSNGAIGQET